jgi:lysophospholipase L1-like esterase
LLIVVHSFSMTRLRLHLLLTTALLLVVSIASSAQTRWIGSWAASQQLAEPHNSLPASGLTTVRQIVRLSIGGPELRLHLSNRFGTAQLHVTAVRIGRPVSPSSGAIIAGTDTAVTFGGKKEVTIPAGEETLSDPVQFPVAALSSVAVSLAVDPLPAQQTGHPGSRATSYVALGDQVSAPDLPAAKSVDHWYFFAGIDVAGAPDSRAVVVLGDSITDGHGATTNGNDRWPDLLAARLQANPATRMVAVLNHGIGGNRILLDGLGPKAISRFDHDVLQQPGVRYFMILEGINDIGMLTVKTDVPQTEHDALVRNILAAYQDMITRAHARNIKAIGATILPFVGSDFYHPGPATEADRQAINEWIRTPGHFDAVVDFDKIMRDPANPDRLLPAFDSGDHLHPSPLGYEAMSQAIPLSLFTEYTGTLQIAFTFDDLPAHASLPPGETRIDVASKIIAALHDAHVPPTYGFTNGVLLENQPADASVLRAWLDAGNKLGNHTWSHMNLNDHTMEEYQTEVLRNEPLLRQWMKNEDFHWFRFPFLAEGNTPEKRGAVRKLLLDHGYKIAGVTMSFADYLYNDAYARCSAKGDTQAIGLLENSWLAGADESISYYRGLSHALFGRDIPYVLLMHLGAFDARMMPRLIDLYRSRGVQFVSLEQAESDPFYKEDTDLSLPPGPDSLEGMMGQRGMSLPPHQITLPDFNKLCR